MLLIEIVPRTGLNLLRYKRRLRRMASEVCPPDKSWQVILLLVGAVAFFCAAPQTFLRGEHRPRLCTARCDVRTITKEF